MRISTCVIALNEEEDLPRCLDSVLTVSDEIIVLDSGSTDATPQIALSRGARFEHKEWSGFVNHKNHAMSLATHEWILLLDADEALSPQLVQQILALKQQTHSEDVVGFDMPRVVFFQGRWIRFGDWYPDRLVRLVRKGTAQFEGGRVHERLVVRGVVKSLSGEIEHYTYRDVHDQQQRTEKYSTLWAQDAYERGTTCYAWTPWIRAGWRWIRGWFFKGGWRGGALGWQICRATAYEVWLKYTKLRRLRQPS